MFNVDEDVAFLDQRDTKQSSDAIDGKQKMSSNADMRRNVASRE
jgi:hypothetical protein